VKAFIFLRPCRLTTRSFYILLSSEDVSGTDAALLAATYSPCHTRVIDLVSITLLTGTGEKMSALIPFCCPYK
jgi:hypothetical protein